MTTDELIYILKNPTESKLDLLNQLRELELSGEDPDLQDYLKLQLDQICGISHLVWEIESLHGAAIREVYYDPALFGKHWTRKPLKHHRESLTTALEALQTAIDEQEWNLVFYDAWRQNIEICRHCLKHDPVNHSCWMDPKGVLRKLYHPEPQTADKTLSDIWGEWNGKYCCMQIKYYA